MDAELRGLHIRPPLFTLFLYPFVYTGHLFLYQPDLFTLPVLVHSCLCLLLLSVHTYLYWPNLFTPAHTRPHLSRITDIHAFHLCSHLLVLAICTCPYILTFLLCDLALARGNLGALRLKVRLTEDRVLPSQYYQPLRELLLESVLGPAEVGAWWTIPRRVCRDLDHGLPLP